MSLAPGMGQTGFDDLIRRYPPSPEEQLAALTRRLAALEQQKQGTEEPKYDADRLTITLGFPVQVIHKIANGIMVTDGGYEGVLVKKQMFFPSYLDYANYLISEAAKKELEK